MRTWSDDHVAFLKLTWPVFSASEIAQCLNECTHPDVPFTKDSIIGKAHRLRLPKKSCLVGTGRKPGFTQPQSVRDRIGAANSEAAKRRAA